MAVDVAIGVNAAMQIAVDSMRTLFSLITVGLPLLMDGYCRILGPDA